MGAAKDTWFRGGQRLILNRSSPSSNENNGTHSFGIDLACAVTYSARSRTTTFLRISIISFDQLRDTLFSFMSFELHQTRTALVVHRQGLTQSSSVHNLLSTL
eukprot:scaffold1763_cov181-Amphora_coffeaeformis.AAC.5